MFLGINPVASAPGFLLRMAAEAADAEKMKTLDNFCIDRACDRDVETAQQKADAMAARLKHSQEMLDTVNKKIGIAERDTQKLLNTVRKYQGEIYVRIFSELEKEIIKKAGTEVKILYAASKRLPSGMWFQNPLPVRLFPEPAPNDLKTFNSILDRKFEKAIR